MAAGEARHGRRDNGLIATAYTAAADVDPRLGERVLDLLAAAGIAAYLQSPRADDPTVPAGRPPADRLYVDHARVAAAHDRLRAFAGEPTNEATVQTPGDGASRAEIDAAFADIVAGYHLSADTPHDPRPVRPIEEEPPPRSRIDLGPYSREPQEPTLLDAFDTFGAGLPDEDADERYVPPPPPPLPRVSKYTVAAVAAIVVGFVLFLAPNVLPVVDDLITTVIGVGLLLLGAGTLISRLRAGTDDDPRDPDDGAVV
ncbi:hypothetical protein GCM10010123_13600 [Pilimelia anulata]|uniref:DUF308 domain-containing protein n=1 Tax=Pilimelia anulata TaxID=53371 RepID=A0A8J3B4N2_9ACTN|nr:DUF308 domain-containing protein [Pilimelia anulata]GGJ85194.1 hypothetical protein GCM10010123_13600 [Pilimelia anulata]